MKKRALNQRVLYKISHLTISSLVLISNKREGQSSNSLLSARNDPSQMEMK